MSADSSSRPKAALEAKAAPGSARTTIVLPVGTNPSRPRICALRRRDTLCRTTDPPTPLPTINPIRVSEAEPLRGSATCTTSSDRAARTPRRVVSGKSEDLRSRLPRRSMTCGRT